MSIFWTDSYEIFLGRLKEDIISGTILAQLDPKHHFYINTDCSKDGIGASLIQTDNSQ